MKEVRLKRFAGPFEEPPFTDFIQSPIGLVPKDVGKSTRLIFHLSYPRDGDSINSCTPKELCSVSYPDIDEAIKRCMEEFDRMKQFEVIDRIFLGKSDFMSAFRNLGMRIFDFKWLTMKTKNPIDGKTYFFVDKCLPFRASISCAHFQAVLNGIAHIIQVKIERRVINYLDDFLFVAALKIWCDGQMKIFMEICETIRFPVLMEKTFWSETKMIFLRLLIDGENRMICLPKEKIMKAIDLIVEVLYCKKTTVRKMQQICGFLNFLGRGIVPGRAFTRRLYSISTTKSGK